VGGSMIERIHWLGHASFRINGPPHHDRSPVIYIDPWRLPDGSTRADLILISHDHYDHCSPEDIALIKKPDTIIISNQRVAHMLGGDVRVLGPWQGAMRVGDASIRTIPAYTLHKAYHDKAYGGLGFLISMMRHDIYYAGDTDLIPEMDKIYCDIAILPVGGAFTMNYDDAAEAVRRMRPRYAIPMSYGREIPGSQYDGQHFCQLVNSGVQALELRIENARL